MSRKFTIKELHQFNGINKEEIYVSILGKVYDVTKSKEMYGKGGSYHVFAGHDATLCLAFTSLESEHLDKPLQNVDDDAMGRVNAFKDRFESKYPTVGYVVDLKFSSSL